MCTKLETQMLGNGSPETQQKLWTGDNLEIMLINTMFSPQLYLTFRTLYIANEHPMFCTVSKTLHKNVLLFSMLTTIRDKTTMVYNLRLFSTYLDSKYHLIH